MGTRNNRMGGNPELNKTLSKLKRQPNTDYWKRGPELGKGDIEVADARRLILKGVHQFDSTELDPETIRKQAMVMHLQLGRWLTCIPFLRYAEKQLKQLKPLKRKASK